MWDLDLSIIVMMWNHRWSTIKASHAKNQVEIWVENPQILQDFFLEIC